LDIPEYFLTQNSDLHKIIYIQSQEPNLGQKTTESDMAKCRFSYGNKN